MLSGTSMDAVDSALVNFTDKNPVLISYEQLPVDQVVREKLISVSKDTRIEDITVLDVEIGQLFAKAALNLLEKNKIKTTEVIAIGSHGQTILHRPEPPEPTTLQIGDPNIIAHTTGITTVADFRRMDMAAGGQGAPLAPLFHKHIFSHQTEQRVVLNIGGMGNITILPSISSNLPVIGFDTGPGNVLIDAWSNQHIKKKMDVNGTWATTGKLNENLLSHFLEDEYFKLTPPKSTGRDYFNKEWLLTKLEIFNKQLLPEDVQRTLTELTAVSIANAIKQSAPETQTVLVCGGGVHNNFLMQSLMTNLSGCKVTSTSTCGVDPDAVEAMTFALLAKYRLEKLPGNIPTVTGANGPVILGAVYLP